MLIINALFSEGKTLSDTILQNIKMSINIMK